jgi:oxygen-independent coproporphyrinogen-3 oxidase
MRKIGIYVQVPFCQTKCTYCNFHTGVVAKARFGPYVNAVCREIRGHRELLAVAGVDWGSGKWRVGSGENQKPKVLRDTVYIGGGTPSLLEAADLGRIVDTVREAFGSGDQTERAGGRKSGGPSSMLGVNEPPHSKAPASEGGRYNDHNSNHKSNHNSNQGDGRCTDDSEDLQRSEQFVEVTLEADPETVEAEKAAGWVAAGINRVSFGVQSFVDEELKAAGRMHRREDIYKAVPILRAAGIRNISFDLIAGLPHQTAESWKRSLGELAALEPEHVSVYLLEVDEGSRLGKELLQGGARYSAGAVPSEDAMAEFYETAQRELRAAGYHHYEISNWAKPGFESKHNLKYWKREPYLGFGAGAHSFSGGERWANAHDAAAYVEAIGQGRLPIEQHEKVSVKQALEEELFLGLRQLDGIDLRRIEQEYGVELGGRFETLTSAGLVEREGSVVRLAPGRLSVSNEVFVELMR